jgi:hypothetical protein
LEVTAAIQHELLLAQGGSASAVPLAPTTAALLHHVDEMHGGALLAALPRPVSQLLRAAREQSGMYGSWAKPAPWGALAKKLHRK